VLLELFFNSWTLLRDYSYRLPRHLCSLTQRPLWLPCAPEYCGTVVRRVSLYDFFSRVWLKSRFDVPYFSLDFSSLRCHRGTALSAAATHRWDSGPTLYLLWSRCHLSHPSFLFSYLRESAFPSSTRTDLYEFVLPGCQIRVLEAMHARRLAVPLPGRGEMKQMSLLLPLLSFVTSRVRTGYEPSPIVLQCSPEELVLR